MGGRSGPPKPNITEEERGDLTLSPLPPSSWVAWQAEKEKKGGEAGHPSIYYAAAQLPLRLLVLSSGEWEGALPWSYWLLREASHRSIEAGDWAGGDDQGGQDGGCGGGAPGASPQVQAPRAHQEEVPSPRPRQPVQGRRRRRAPPLPPHLQDQALPRHPAPAPRHAPQGTAPPAAPVPAGRRR
jgi:hypothetical protein